jgi:hypothetical protein
LIGCLIHKRISTLASRFPGRTLEKLEREKNPMNSTPIHELYLAAGVALSLILPLMASALAPKDSGESRPWLRTVWAGQGLLAFGGLLIVFSPLHPGYGLGVAVASCSVFGVLLHRQLRRKERIACS